MNAKLSDLHEELTTVSESINFENKEVFLMRAMIDTLKKGYNNLLERANCKARDASKLNEVRVMELEVDLRKEREDSIKNR